MPDNGKAQQERMKKARQAMTVRTHALRGNWIDHTASLMIEGTQEGGTKLVKLQIKNGTVSLDRTLTWKDVQASGKAVVRCHAVEAPDLMIELPFAAMVRAGQTVTVFDVDPAPAAEPSKETKDLAEFVYKCVRWAQHGANEGLISTKDKLEPGDATITHIDGSKTIVDLDPSFFLMEFWEATGRFVEFEETAQVVKDMILKGMR